MREYQICVSLCTEEDYKPNANAGPDVEIKLPINFAILNGSGSTDDHGIASYEWTKTSDNVADITVSGSISWYLQPASVVPVS